VTRPRGRNAAPQRELEARRANPERPWTSPVSGAPSSLRVLDDLLARSGGTGIDTSEGLLFNHTLWGRDRAITALDVLDHRPEAARQSILALARLQGTARHFRSEEEPGRIHSEHRDFRVWQAPLHLKLAMRFIVSPLWGGGRFSYTSYFAADSTPLYLMLVSEYAHIDPGILAAAVERRDGSTITVRDSVLLAAAWLLEHMAADGLVEIAGRNPLSLPSPVWRDSPTSNLDENGLMPDLLEPIAWLDLQLLTFDAFRSLAALLRAEATGDAGGDHTLARAGQGQAAETARLLEELADALRATTLRHFWMPGEQYFGFALDRDHAGRRKLLRAIQSNAGWLLAGGFLDGLPAEERAMYVRGIARTLFSPDMLTDAGVRGRSRRYSSLGFLNYHEPVWPLDSLRIAAGLRRQGLPRLAEQIENRVLNAVNALGAHYEFIPVDRDGRIVDPTLDWHRARAAATPGRPLPTEMVPDVDLAWSVTGVLRVKLDRARRERERREASGPAGRDLAGRDPLAYRGRDLVAGPGRDRLADRGLGIVAGPVRDLVAGPSRDAAGERWAEELTDEILARIEDVPAVRSHADMRQLRGRLSPLYLSHWSGVLRSARFIATEGLGRALPAAYLGRRRHRPARRRARAIRSSST
jgi:hypothetical protein